MKFSRLLAAGITLAALSANAGDIIIYEAGSFNPLSGLTNNGNLVLINGKKAGSLFKKVFMSEDATTASKNITLVRDFYNQEFGRNSYDGKGANILAVVKVGRGPVSLLGMLGLDQNAAWDKNGKRFLFGTGEKDNLNNFTGAVDVIGHEYTHAVVESTTKLEALGQSGALNEHLSDVFGQYIQVKTGKGANDFLIGETVLGDDLKQKVAAKYGFTPKGLRDMLNPQLSIPPQPTEMKQIPAALGPNCKATAENDKCGVHLLAGIPNRAISLAVQKLGWDKVAHVVYVVMTEKLPKNADFSTYASETISECGRQLSSSECAAFDSAFKSVGL
ncbi:M4 family metallopeptidase [Bdellovibrio sp. HCB337]|uniref:M4 family metallopeptidase n=1 Tax=Bdellovibrio sp. HCB337 TaxID=3394358 RepID=UPI0039A4702B